MVSICNATTSDIPTIQNIANKTWWPTYRPILKDDQIAYMLETIYSAEAIQKSMEAGQHFVLLLDERGAQGFASYANHGDKTTKLHKLYVLPDNHGQGFGKMLIQEVIERSKFNGSDTLILNVNRYNPALEFYLKFGFEIAQEVDVPIGPYWMNDYVLELRL